MKQTLVGVVVALGAILVPGRLGADDSLVIYGQPEQVGQLDDERISESSGLARCLGRPGWFWTMNDSGDEPRLFLIDSVGKTRGVVQITDAELDDWEDLCSFRLDETDYLLIADTGDNGKGRDHVTLYCLEEPGLNDDGSPRRKKASVSTRIRVKYEDGRHDCEAVGVDVTSRKILLVAKERALQCKVYEAPLDLGRRSAKVVAKQIATVPLPLVTGMSISADGRRAVLLTYLPAVDYVRREGEDWQKALRRAPRIIDTPARKQGEAVCYGDDDQTLFLTSEGVRQPFWRVPVAPAQAKSPRTP